MTNSCLSVPGSIALHQHRVRCSPVALGHDLTLYLTWVSVSQRVLAVADKNIKNYDTIRHTEEFPR
jgi:hypothetical protein